MKKDELEDFVAKNRESFYDENPPADVWSNVESSLPARRNPSAIRMFLRVAAAALVLVTITIAATRYFIMDNINYKATALNREVRMNPRKIIIVEKKSDAGKTVYAHKQTETEQDNSQIVTRTREDKQKVYPDIEEINQFYKSQIYDRKNEIIRLASVSGEINRQVDMEIMQMDSLYKSVIRDLKDNMNNREVVEGLINQYRLKIEFLDNILQMIRENENQTVNQTKYEM